MMASECGCGFAVVLRREHCPRCGGPMSQIDIEDNAVLLTYTTLHTVPEGFDPPVTLVLVELDRGVKLLCGCRDPESLVIGQLGKVFLEGDLYHFIVST